MGRRGQHFHGYDEDSGLPHDTAYFVWLVESEGHTVLVDTGMRPSRAGELEYRAPVSLLRDFGVAPEDVDLVVLTHLHYDHAGTVADFPGARFVVQRSEVDYWTGPWAKRIERERWLLDSESLAWLVESDRLSLVDGDEEVLPGISVHLVGGHTAGMQVVRVAAPDPVVLASDASHFFENLEDDRPAPLIHSMPGMYAAFDRITELAGPGGIVVPGHDPQVLHRFPPVADGIVRVA
ncbi:N-acyl homoserine lactonase family protein [Amycolatopsis bartoniae]|nr:N-acyl homoserine lactonase family protein [Amycolatopsis bartoniae]